MIVIGVGNPWRGDDGAGPAVARLTGGVEHAGDCLGLPDLWEGCDEVALVDAALGGAAPGTVHRHDAAAGPLPARFLRSSTHDFGVAEAIEVARALGRLPARVVVYAIEGADFGDGNRLSPPVESAVGTLARQLCDR